MHTYIHTYIHTESQYIIYKHCLGSVRDIIYDMKQLGYCALFKSLCSLKSLNEMVLSISLYWVSLTLCRFGHIWLCAHGEQTKMVRTDIFVMSNRDRHQG